MNNDFSVKKPKEKQMRKEQSSSDFFKDPSKKKKKKSHVSHVEIGVPDPIEEQQKVLVRPTPCTVLAVSTTLFLLILLIIALGELGLHDISAFKWTPKPQGPPRQRLEFPCETKECVRYSAHLLDMMNSTIDPCENFHGHVCSEDNPKKRNFDNLLKLIDRRQNPDHPKAVKIVRKLLSKCALGRSREVDQEEHLKAIIPSNLPFPILSYNWNHSSSSSDFNLSSNSSEYPYKHEHLTDILIHISLYTPDDLGIIGIKPSSDSEFSLFIVKPDSPILTSYQFRNVFEILKRNLPETKSNTRKNPEIDWQRQLNDAIELQRKLKNIVFEIHSQVINLTDIQSKLPIVNWKSLIDSWYKNGSEAFEGKIYGFNISYYNEINNLLSSTPPETVYNLFLLRFSFKFLRSELSSELEETCLRQVSHTIPGKIVLYGSAEPNATDMLKSMLGTIHDHLKKSLTTLKWLDGRGIEEAQKKFNKTKTRFGFDGEQLIDELSITSNSSYISTLRNVLEWQTRNMFNSIAKNITSVFLNSEVFYSAEKNEITISRALLHYPFMSSHLPNYTNYATIASRIIPHLIHVFDERGRFYDSNGKERNWWNSETERYFKVIRYCFEKMTQNVFGVSVSIGWNAYNSTKEPYATLPGLEASSDTALFFYSLAKTMCGSNSSRVNEALASVPQFNIAFKCRNNTKMNRKTRCRLAS